jgi:hypothetical protein
VAVYKAGSAFVPVTNITGVATSGTVGTPVTLNGTVAPTDATNQTIVWSLGTGSTAAGASVSGGVASATGAGTVVVKATITNGLAVGTDYTQNFTITFSAAGVAPTLTGPTSMTLTAGYAATSTDVYTATGSPMPTIAKTSGDAAITWNSGAQRLDIAAGLTAGTYPVVLTASNGITPDATITFTLTVVNPTTYSVSIAVSGVGGMVYSDKTTAAAGETVTLSISPDTDYELSTLSAYHTSSPSTTVAVSGSGATRTFIMPAANVTVAASFQNTVANEEIAKVQLSAYAQNGTLHVKGLTVGKPWYIFNLSGQLIYTGIAADDKAEKQMPEKGIYIIRADAGTIKVIVN